MTHPHVARHLLALCCRLEAPVAEHGTPYRLTLRVVRHCITVIASTMPTT